MQENRNVTVPEDLELPPLLHMLELPHRTIDELRNSGKRVGVTFGAFDLLHAGHMTMFKEAKQNACDFLFVGLQSNPRHDRPTKNAPSETLQERHWRVDSCKYIDAYAMYHDEADLLSFLTRHARQKGGFIDVRILDEAYKDKPYTGKGIIEPYYNWRDHPWSTSTLKKRVFNDERKKYTFAA